MILDNSTLSGAIPDTTNPMANLQVGGWDGLNPGLGVIGADGVARSLLVANQPYVKRPSIFIMLTYPMAFNYYNNKAELINAIAAEAGLSKVDAKKALDAVVKSVSDALVAGDKVSLVGFGTFSVAERAARPGINPATKQAITIEAKKVAKFKAGAELTAAIN